MLRLCASLSLAAALLAPSVASAGPVDPWWLLYRVRGGTLTHKAGPYRTRPECQAARYRLPVGSEFLGCFQ